VILPSQLEALSKIELQVFFALVLIQRPLSFKQHHGITLRQGVHQIKAKLPEKYVSIFMMPPPYGDLEAQASVLKARMEKGGGRNWQRGSARFL
jgi:hypothetical protein